MVDGECSSMGHGARNVFCKTRPLFYILLTFGGRMHNNLKFNFPEKSTKEELMMTRPHRAVRLCRLWNTLHPLSYYMSDPISLPIFNWHTCVCVCVCIPWFYTVVLLDFWQFHLLYFTRLLVLSDCLSRFILLFNCRFSFTPLVLVLVVPFMLFYFSVFLYFIFAVGLFNCSKVARRGVVAWVWVGCLL